MNITKTVIYLRGNHQIASLLTISLMAVILLTFRVFLTRDLSFSFLIWNLFLAWVPLFFIKCVWNIDKKSSLSNWLIAVCLIIWLLFFPNAPYIITDLKHLRRLPESMIWYDAILFFSFAFSGLLTGLYSLRIVLRILKRRVSEITSWLFVTVFVILSSFGIYLGRFGRWNSWDIITQPDALAKGIINSVTNPLAIKHTATFSFVLMLLYLTFHIFAEIKSHETNHRYTKNHKEL